MAAPSPRSSGATSITYSFFPTEGQTGSQYEAIFTSGSNTITTNVVTLTVTGTAFTSWLFPAQVSSGPNGAGPAVSPLPTVGAGTATPLGMVNSYTGVQSQNEEDITGTSGTLNSGYTENTWRIRGGSGKGATGTPGTPDGWTSGNPQYTQGVEFDASTVGYSNVTFSTDWYATTSGLRDLQPQYTIDGSHWINYGTSPLIAIGNDYYGSSNSSTTPTGLTLNFQGIAGVNNDANFGVRLVGAYDSALPNIVDGNTNNPGSHGQYATATPGAAFTSQELAFVGSGISGSFTLTLPDSTGTLQTTGPISYDPSSTNLALNIANALGALASVGTKTTGGVTTSNATVTSLDGINSNFIVTFPAAQGGSMTVNTSGLSGTASGSAPLLSVDYAGALVPFTIAGSGNWRFGNVNFDGTTTSGAPGILTQPVAQTATIGIAPTVSFTASAYSEENPTTAAWQYSTNGSAPWNSVLSLSGVTPGSTVTSSSATSGAITTTSTFTITAVNGENNYQFRAVFSDAGGSATTNGAVLSVVPAAPPMITLQPTATSTVAGNSAAFTANATGSPDPTVQWQVSSDGVNFTNVSTATTTTTNTTTTNTINSTLNVTTTVSTPTGQYYRAVFTNVANAVNSNAVQLTVLAAEPALTQWNFGGTDAGGIVAAPDNNPAPNINIAAGRFEPRRV